MGHSISNCPAEFKQDEARVFFARDCSSNAFFSTWELCPGKSIHGLYCATIVKLIPKVVAHRYLNVSLRITNPLYSVAIEPKKTSEQTTRQKKL